jgi:hypothetical protein
MKSWISRLILRKAVHRLHITWRTIRTIFRYQTEQPKAVKQPFNCFYSNISYYFTSINKYLNTSVITLLDTL